MNSSTVLFCVFLAVGTLTSVVWGAKDLGKLECDEKDGMKPNSKLLNMIMSKCQPKQGQEPTAMAAGLVKCIMKQYKAIDKKTGKMKKTEAMSIISIFPDQFKDDITKKFNECYDAHSGDIKKEQNGADSWIPYTKCFYEFSQNLCPKKS